MDFLDGPTLICEFSIGTLFFVVLATQILPPPYNPPGASGPVNVAMSIGNAFFTLSDDVSARGGWNGMFLAPLYSWDAGLSIPGLKFRLTLMCDVISPLPTLLALLTVDACWRPLAKQPTHPAHGHPVL